MNMKSIFRRDFIKKSVIGTISTFIGLKLSAKSRQEEDISAPYPFLAQTPILCEIQIVAFKDAPKGWAFCNGQELPINQNQALYSLLGTKYGGNGTTTFALPDFRGRMPIQVGGIYQLGQKAGVSDIALTSNQIPSLSVVVQKVNNRDNVGTQGVGVLDGGLNGYTPNVIARTGTGTPHTNMPPFQALNFIIAIQGVFPSRG
jgi:microcystin-dependent protein